MNARWVDPASDLSVLVEYVDDWALRILRRTEEVDPESLESCRNCLIVLRRLGNEMRGVARDLQGDCNE